MSRVFIPLGNGGYLNLDEVRCLYEGKNPRDEWTLHTKDGQVLEAWPPPEYLIIQIIPCTSPMHMVCVHEPDKEKPCEFTWEPVIAWGLTLMGEILPITPTETRGPQENLDWGLREPGTDQIMVPFDGTYDNQEQWGAAHKQFMQARREVQAAHDKKKKKEAG